MIRSFLMLFFVFLMLSGISQEKPVIYLTNSSLLSNGSTLPFWMWANQYGTINAESRFLNMSEIGFNFGHQQEKTGKLSWSVGTTFAGGLAGKNYTQINEAFVSAGLRGWEIWLGMFQEQENYLQLSTSNGNLARSTNARPHPTIRLSTKDYLPFPFFKKHLAFKAEYDEGILNDNRFVENTHLHHKSLYIRISPTLKWDIRLGFEHFVMWGGESRDERYGKLPSGLDSYWRYVFGASGDDAFPLTDQINVAGNQFGTYQAEVIRSFQGGEVVFYISHPYEDYSGLVWRNWPDNLTGIHLRFSDPRGWITGLLYEFTNTRQQSIKDSLYDYNPSSGKWVRNENDNYFSHGVYRSGYTYHGKMMGSPLFFPVTTDENGIPIIGGGAIGSSRFVAHHVGITGLFARYFHWKVKTTGIVHYGTYSNSYEFPQKQISAFLKLQYIHPNFPVELGLTIAADKQNSGENISGAGLSVTKRW